MQLERLQAEFAAALGDPAQSAGLLAALVPGDGRAAERIGLYRGNVVAAREKALANAYPVVRALVGKEYFAGLARAYGRAHPSRSGDLNRFGEHLAAFIAAFEPARSLPYLADVATLEAAVHAAHYAADAQALARDALASLPADRLLGARFVVHPAFAAIESAFPVTGIWLAHQPDSQHALPQSLQRGESAIVVRPRWRVEVLESSAGEIAALGQLRDGADMGCAIGAALHAEPAFNFARALVRWIDHAVLVGMPPQGPSHA